MVVAPGGGGGGRGGLEGGPGAGGVLTGLARGLGMDFVEAALVEGRPCTEEEYRVLRPVGLSMPMTSSPTSATNLSKSQARQQNPGIPAYISNASEDRGCVLVQVYAAVVIQIDRLYIQ